MSDQPSPKGAKGNGSRFAKGIPAARAILRQAGGQVAAALFDVATPDDLKTVVPSLIAEGKGGDVDRHLGLPEQVANGCARNQNP